MNREQAIKELEKYFDIAARTQYPEEKVFEFITGTASFNDFKQLGMGEEQMLDMYKSALEKAQTQKIQEAETSEWKFTDVFRPNALLMPLLERSNPRAVLNLCNMNAEYRNYCSNDKVFRHLGLIHYPEEFKHIHSNYKETYEHLTNLLGKVWAYGNLGYINFINRNEIIESIPKPLDNLPKIKQIDSKYGHHLLLDINGKVWGFGDNDWGQLGLGNYTSSIELRSIDHEYLPKIKQVECGHDFSALLDINGRVWTFGANMVAKLGLGNEPEYHGGPIFATPENSNPMPQLLDYDYLPEIKQISCGAHTILLDINGKIWGFGDNARGQLGFERGPKIVDNDYGFFQLQFTSQAITMPQLLDYDYLPEIKQISCGKTHTILLDINGKVWGFGNNDRGQLGFGDNIGEKDYNKPKLLDYNYLPEIKQISCGSSHTGLIDINGEVWMFGEGYYGQLGFGDRINWKIPKLLKYENFPRIKQISCGSSHTGLTDVNGEVWMFGEGYHGQLGFGDLDDANIPYKYTYEYLPKIKRIACGYETTLILG